MRLVNLSPRRVAVQLPCDERHTPTARGRDIRCDASPAPLGLGSFGRSEEVGPNAE